MAIQITGSLILIIFGYFIFNSHPSAQPKPSESRQFTIFGDFITSFGLTLSNPLVLFVLIAIFAKFEFITNKSTLAEISIGIISILSGALLWWSILTSLVSRFRMKLNLKGLITLNKITGIIIVLIGIVGFLYSIYNKV